jgi:hypothetical protein
VPARIAFADNFVLAYYDPRADQLVVTMSYLGTNPDHSFSLHWGPCKSLPDGAGREMVAEVLDSQWQDAARKWELMQEDNDFRSRERIGISNHPSGASLPTT